LDVGLRHCEEISLENPRRLKWVDTSGKFGMVKAGVEWPGCTGQYKIGK